MDIRKFHTVIDETHLEGGVEVSPATRVAVVAAVIQNPWHGQGFVQDLSEGVAENASLLGETLTPLVMEALGAPPEAYGKAAIVGVEGEIEHGSALIHTLKFGNHFRDAANATTLLPAVEKRGSVGATFDIPLKHITDQTMRSHHQSVEVSIPDAPHVDEIIIALSAASGGRPQQRLAAFSEEA